MKKILFILFSLIAFSTNAQVLGSTKTETYQAEFEKKQSINVVADYDGEPIPVQVLSIGISEDVYVTIPRRDYDNLKPTLEVKAKLEAPINKGDSLGTVTVMLGNDVVTTRPLVALAQVEKGSLWRRFLDFIYQLLGME